MGSYQKEFDCRDCGLRDNLFCSLADEQIGRIDNEREEMIFDEKETIFKTGGPLTHLICLHSGMLKVYLEEPGSHRILLSVFTPGSMIRGPGFLTDNHHHITVSALERSKVCLIPVKTVEKMMHENAGFAVELARELNNLIIKYFNRITCITHKHMRGKMANTLLYLADKVYLSNSFHTKLSRQDIADMSAMTKESAIRMLKDFSEEGLLELKKNKFSIINREKLEYVNQNG